MAKKNLLKLGIVCVAGAVITTACLVGCNTSSSSSASTPSFIEELQDSEVQEKLVEAFIDIGNELNISDDVAEIMSEVTENISSEVASEPLEEQSSEQEVNDLSEATKVTVVRVVDGDTYVVNLDGEETKIRLIGVDTPESVAPESYTEKTGKENTEEGKNVSDYMKEKLPEGSVLFLEFDVNKYDKYDRVLAYAYFEDGEMVQEHLLKKGYAQVMTIQPNVAHSERFVELEQKAMEEGVGMWENYAELFEEQEQDEVER